MRDVQPTRFAESPEGPKRAEYEALREQLQIHQSDVDTLYKGFIAEQMSAELERHRFDELCDPGDPLRERLVDLQDSTNTDARGALRRAIREHDPIISALPDWDERDRELYTHQFDIDQCDEKTGMFVVDYSAQSNNPDVAPDTQKAFAFYASPDAINELQSLRTQVQTFLEQAQERSEVFARKLAEEAEHYRALIHSQEPDHQFTQQDLLPFPTLLRKIHKDPVPYWKGRVTEDGRFFFIDVTEDGEVRDLVEIPIP